MQCVHDTSKFIIYHWTSQTKVNTLLGHGVVGIMESHSTDAQDSIPHTLNGISAPQNCSKLIVNVQQNQHCKGPYLIKEYFS